MRTSSCVSAVCLITLLLGGCKKQHPVERLIAETQKDSPDAQVIAKLIARGALGHLVYKLRSTDEVVRKGTADALVKVGEPAVPPLMTAILDWHPNDAKMACVVLLRLGDKAVAPLIAALGDDRLWVRMRWAALLGMIGDVRATEPLIAKLEDSHPDMEKSVTKALGKIGEPAMESLIVALEHENPHVRKGAAKALGLIGDIRSLEPLCSVLTNDLVRWVQGEAAWALGQIGDARAVEPLIAELGIDRSGAYASDIRDRSAQALVQIGDKAVEQLIIALRNDNAKIRKQVASVLEQMGAAPQAGDLHIWYLIAARKWDECAALGDVAVIPLLTMIGDSSDHGVQGGAIESLGQIGDSRAIEPLLAKLDVSHGFFHHYPRKQAVKALGKIGNAAVEPLIVALKHDSESVRVGAVESLGQIGNAKAAEPLITTLGDDSRHVRKATAEALGLVGDVRAVVPLVECLTDRYVNQAAAESLERLSWKPDNTADRIHLLIANRNLSDLTTAENWPHVKAVLLHDAASGNQLLVEFAVHTFVGIGHDDALPELLTLIEAQGTKTIAEAFLNCNHAKLNDAAKRWAKEHGYDITSIRSEFGPETWDWGKW